MRKVPFTRPSEDSLIVVKGYLGTHSVGLAVDTGASHTTIDLNHLLMAGYEIKNAVGTIPIETASGELEAYVFNVKKFTCLGITKQNVEIAAYDFFAYRLLSDFDGVLGLDFFDTRKMCIDFKRNLILIDE